jgi:predicted DNA-binding ribbon-helix-helix protein
MKRPKKKSRIVKRGVLFAGHNTSVSLEDAFWNAIREIAAKRGLTIGALVSTIENNRRHKNLSSAIRVYVLDYYRRARPKPRTHRRSRIRIARSPR